MELWDEFVNLVRIYFVFLETDYGFIFKEQKAPFVFYQSDKIEVRVYYGRRHELDLRIARLSDDPRKFPSVGLGELMKISSNSNSQKIRTYISPFPNTEAKLKIEIPKLAELLKQFGAKILLGDPIQFTSIELSRESYALKINRQTMTRQERPD